MTRGSGRSAAIVAGRGDVHAVAENVPQVGFGHLRAPRIVPADEQDERFEDLLHRHDVHEIPVQAALLAEHADFVVAAFPVEALSARIERQREEHDLVKAVLLRRPLERRQQCRAYTGTARLPCDIDRQIRDAR